MKFKVLKGLASELCMMRELRSVYETNRAFKAAALYTWIKNETTSGQITLSCRGTVDRICSDLCISRAGVYNYLRYAQDHGLISRTKTGPVLAISYDKLCEKLLLDRVFIEIEIDPAMTKLEYALKALEYQEARERMKKGLDAKVRNNPRVKAAFAIEAVKITQQAEEPKFSPVDLFWLQKSVFALGGSETTYNELFTPNPDLNRNLFTLAMRRKMRSHVSAAYERRRLAELELLQLETRTAISCPYKGKPQPGRIKGRAKHRRRVYDAQKGCAKWFLPSSVEINPKTLRILAAEETPQNPRQC